MDGTLKGWSRVGVAAVCIILVLMAYAAGFVPISVLMIVMGVEFVWPGVPTDPFMHTLIWIPGIFTALLMAYALSHTPLGRMAGLPTPNTQRW